MNRIRSDFHKKSTGYKLIAVAICSTVMGYLIGSSFSSILTEKVEMIHLNTEDTDYRADYKSALPKCSLSNSEWQISRSDFASSTVNIRSGDSSKIRLTTNPRGTETLPPGIIETHSDFYLHQLHGNSGEDLVVKPKYLLALTVGYLQKDVINSLVSKFSENFSFILFHYDGRTSEWNQFEWSKRAIHISARKQTKWWYAKRFLHPDIVAPYEYIFIWDEDLGVEHFTAEKYVKLVKKHGLEISQPGLEPNNSLPWLMTKRREDAEVHKEVEERPGWCHDPHLPPCAGFVEIMAPVFSRESWRCAWHMIQNDLVHGWGLDLALRRCVEPPHEKIGVVDAQWIEHKVLPSLGNQGEALDGRAPWEGVRARCNFEWKEFERRMDAAEKDYLHTHHLQ